MSLREFNTTKMILKFGILKVPLIWHFLIQASIELGLTPDDILKEYQRKNEINRQRQNDGY